MNDIVETQNSGEISIKDHIKNQNTLLVFVRHLGWPVCREFLSQLRESNNKINSLGVSITVVAPSSASFIEKFLEAFGPFPFDILGDPSRNAYKNLGHVTMPKWKLLSMAAIGFITGKVKNFVPKEEQKKEFVLSSMKTQDVYIQGGTWLISKNGDVLWKHIDQSPEDHPSVDEIISRIKEKL